MDTSLKDLADDTLLVGGSHPLFTDAVGADSGGHGVAEPKEVFLQGFNFPAAPKASP